MNNRQKKRWVRKLYAGKFVDENHAVHGFDCGLRMIMMCGMYFDVFGMRTKYNKHKGV